MTSPPRPIVVATRAVSVGVACFVAFSAAWTLAHLLPGAFPLGAGMYLHMLRWASFLALGVAVAQGRAPGRSRGRAFAECAALALALQELSFLLWAGAMLLPPEALGPLAGAGGSVVALADVVDMQVGQLLSASFHASWVGLAVGVHLAAPRLGRRSAGLALVGPVLLGDAVGYLGLLAFDRDLLLFLLAALALSLVGGALTVPSCVALGDRLLRARGLLDEDAMG